MGRAHGTHFRVQVATPFFEIPLMRMWNQPFCRGLLALIVPLLALATGRAQPASPHHVIVVTIDGLRWQEFFGGAAREYLKRDRTQAGGEPERRFWRDTREERRAARTRSSRSTSRR